MMDSGEKVRAEGGWRGPGGMTQGRERRKRRRDTKGERERDKKRGRTERKWSTEGWKGLEGKKMYAPIDL